MKKRILIMAAAATFVMSGCKNNQSEDIVNFHLPTGLPTLSMLKQMKENDNVIRNYRIVYELENTPVSLRTAVLSGKPDIAIVPSTLAAVAYNKDASYSIIGTVGYGSLYITSTDESVSKLEDLSGKRICYFGKGDTPEITTRSILSEKGINVLEPVEADYYDLPSLATKIASGNGCEQAVVAEPVLTNLIMGNKIKKYISLNDAYKVAGENEHGFPQSVLIAKATFIDKNDVFINELMKSLELSTKWLNNVEKQEEVKEYLAHVLKTRQIGIEESKVLSNILNANLNFVPAETTIPIFSNYYTKLNNFNSAILGGHVPSEEAYYKVQKAPKTLLSAL